MFIWKEFALVMLPIYDSRPDQSVIVVKLLVFNEAVMAELYIEVSEMSIVGPPPRFLGGVFFAKKQPSGRRFEAEPRAI